MNNGVSKFICYGLPIPIIIISLLMGSSAQINIMSYFHLLFQKIYHAPFTPEQTSFYEMTTNILLNVRLPRVILTFMVGAALSVSGAILQSLFRNPLVDSYILGISSGAAFGASLAILFAFASINLFAFVVGFVAVILTYLIAGFNKQASTITVVLSGMIVSGIFIALLTLVQYISNPYKLQAIIQWTLGNLNATSWTEVNQAIIPILISLICTYFYRWRLNLLSLGDDAARSVGVNPVPDKIILVICATLMTTTTVAVAGIISFYGLFVPHIVRMLLGADNNKIIPGCIFFGGTFLLIIDTLSRTLFVFEIPIGIFTTLLGGGFFVFLLKNNKLNWN